MAGVLAGFATIISLIAVGYFAARTGTIPAGGENYLTRIVFFLAMPALLFITMMDADPTQLFSPLLVGVAASVGLSALTFFLLAPRQLRTSDRIIGTMASCYVNAGNLGIAIAAYVLGDATIVAPVLLVQLLVLAPVGLAALDVVGKGSTTRRVPWLAPLANPIIIGAIGGLVVGLLPWELPWIVREPIVLLSGAAIPLALLLFGISLVGAFSAGAVRPSRELWLVVVVKNLLHPTFAYVLGTYLLGLSTPHVLALTVLSALPTAQNIFVYAMRYDAGIALARSTVLATTAASVPVLIAIAALLT